jgi:carboxypeptidase family protein
VKLRTLRPGLCSFLLLFASCFMMAQTAALSGSVKDSQGHAVPNATVSAKNAASGQSVQVQTGADGTYTAPNLVPGEYEVSVTAAGFNAETQKITLAADAARPLNVVLTQALSLQSLGFPSSATQANPEEQARLDRRSHMLKVHQKLGLITTVPLVATVFTGNLAGGKSTSSTGRDVHAVLGSATAGLYFTSAYYAMFAPKIPGTETHGNIRLHKMLAWIHGPGMVLTPILGAMAYEQKSNGEKIHGIASAHMPVAIITAGAYGAAILAVSWRSRRRHISTDGQP